jgi:hypothetical protein
MGLSPQHLYHPFIHSLQCKRRVVRLTEGVVENVVVRLDEIYGSSAGGGDENAHAGDEEAIQQLTTFGVFVRVMRERREA